MKIPKGKVKTYKEVAIGINSSKSARAVANACAKNPYAPKVPVSYTHLRAHET